MDLSIVTTLYHSAPYLKELHARLGAAAEKITGDYEIIFVNDGSPDDSLDIAVSLYRQDHRVKVIDLSRNFGHHKAIMTGLAQATGDLVFLLDSDLEEEPESLGLFFNEMKRTNADVIYGVQQLRKGNWFERMTGALYYKLFNALSTDPVSPNLTTARLMSRRYVTALVEHKEREICLSGLWVITGFDQRAVAVHKHAKGRSTYSFAKRVANLVNGVTSFSSKPLVFVFYLGFGIMSLSSLAALYLIIRRVFFGVLLEGWPSLIVSVWLLGGVTICCLGIIGIYVSKIFMETKQRPYTLIRHTYDHQRESR